MPPAEAREPRAASSPYLEAFEAVSEAVESGAGLPAVARAAAGALDASVVVLDGSGAVLAVACLSPEDERAVLAGEGETEALDLRVADERVGQLRIRPRGEPPAASLLRIVATLIGQEADRSRAPERASEAAVGDFLSDLLNRATTDRDNILARAAELGCDLSDGASVIVARARPQQAEEGDWRARVLAVAQRGVRGVARTSLAATIALGPPRHRQGDARALAPDPELAILVPGAGREPGIAAADAVLKELELGLSGYALTVALSRPAPDPTDLHRAGAEALMAANVAEARGAQRISFEETGAYRLLLPAMSEDPAELQRFHDETVAPLIEYDDQYETELVRTLESFLAADGNVAKTAEKLFTHRHTIRYRLDRVRELTGLDVGSTDGRERLSLGLKSMRVLGIHPPGGPAYEAGTEAGRVPREEKDR
jgi:PucR family transcriptional regulator, purine catabolism regulatory protein